MASLAPASRLVHGFEHAGGLFDDRELLGWLRGLGEEQPISRLARQIVERRIVAFEGEAATWFPCCQFEPESGHVRPIVLCVLAELEKVFEPCEIADWLITPSPWLANEPPANLLTSQPEAVFDAARIDRFILAG